MSKIISGINDLYTTNPELVHLLLNPEEAHTISIHSHKKTDFKCDYCGSIIRNCIIRNVFRYGLRCPICSDNISFGEKIISNLLSQLNIDYEYDKTTSWSNNRRYDFIIKSHSLIIETHGLQHYKDVNFHNKSKTLKDEQENDLYKKQLALKNNISHYVEINTSKYDFKFIKQSILESELNDLFDLSNIDWTKLFYSVNNSKVREVCDLWNSGIKNIDELANIVKISPSSVRHYLFRCNSAGLCYYSTDMRKKVICVDNGKIYDSLKSNGLLDKILEVIPDDEYNELYSFMEEEIEVKQRYDLSISGLISKVINELPANAEAAMKIVENFDPEKFSNVLEFAKSINNGQLPTKIGQD